jgi:hypothetical protein
VRGLQTGHPARPRLLGARLAPLGPLKVWRHAWVEVQWSPTFAMVAAAVEHVGACGVKELAVESASRVEDQVANGSGLRKERVVARVEFNDFACSARELALRIGGRAVIVRTHQIGSRYVLPCR